MSKVLKLVLGLLVGAVFILGIFWIQRERVSPLSSEIVSVVSQNDVLRIPFAKAMDQKSVEENLILPDGVSGQMRWEQNDLLFQPGTPLEPGKKYVFTVLKDAVEAEGGKLSKNLDFPFQVRKIPKLISQVPLKDALEVSLQSKITLIFDTPLIALSSVEEKRKKAQSFQAKITPELKGRWRFLSTDSIVFEPESKMLPAATRFTVRVPPGIPSALGDLSTEDFSWNFETLRPKVVSFNPEKGDQFAPNIRMVLSFNLPMDLAREKPFIHLFQEEKDNPKVREIPLETSFSEIEGKQIQQSILLSPKETLQLKKNYRLEVDAGILAEEGNLGSKELFPYSFSTPGDLTVSASRPYSRLDINFSNPIDASTLQENIKLSPEPKDWKDIKLEPPSWNNNRTLSLYADFAPSTSYTLTVKTGLRDQFGQFLKEPYQFQFTTAPLEPEVYIDSKGDFGMFEKKFPPVYHVNLLNVSRVDFQFAKLSVKEFLNLQASLNSQWDYEADLSKSSGVQNLSLPRKQNIQNEWEIIALDIEKTFTKKKLESGIYAMTIQSPEYKKNYGNLGPIIQHQFFAITDMVMTLKFSGTKALLWVMSTVDGKAIANAEIKFHALDGKILIQGKTNEQGFFETDLNISDFSVIGSYDSYRPEFYVTAKTEADFSFISNIWGQGISPYNFSLSSDFVNPAHGKYVVDNYLFTERPIYRAGDTVHFKGIVRFRDEHGVFSLPDAERKAFIIITDSRRKEVYNKNLPINAFGSFSDDLIISPDAALGDYFINLQVSGGDFRRNYGFAKFAVLAYRKPEYRVDLTPEKEDYFSGDTVKVNVEGAYYFGAPLKNARVQYRVMQTDFFFNRYQDGYYAFALEDAWCYFECQRESKIVTEAEGVLDETGHVNIQVPVTIDDSSVSQVFTIEADVSDPNNQIVSNRASVMVHKSKVYVGINSLDYVVEPGEKAKFSLVTVNTDGSVKPNQRVMVKLFQREWNSIKKQGVDGEFYYDSEAKDTFVREVSVKTNEEGKGIAEVLVEKGGEHRAVSIVMDDQGRESKAGATVYATSLSYVNWSSSNTDRLEIVSDKPKYKIGETAKLIVKSPWQGENIQALVTIEREQMISKKIVTIESTAMALEIPITDEMVPNAYVSVVIVKPRVGETFNDNGLDTGAPAFRMGYKKLLVETEKKKITVTIEADKKKYGPGETVQVLIKTQDFEGKAVKTELSLGVVDMSLLALTGFSLPDLVNVFYSERPLGILTAETLIYFIERFKPGSKGGGGGDAELKKRGNFKDTAYWNPSIETNDQGEATVSFVLPDNLTTWQLLSIGSTKEHTFGSQAMTIIETKKVIVRPVRPRFAVIGDEIELGAIVHNFLDQKTSFEVSLSGTGFTGSGKQKITLNPEAQEKLIFPIRVEPGKELVLNMLATSGDARDEIEEKIPVYEFGTLQDTATFGTLTEAVTERILIPSKDEASFGHLELSVSPTLASYLPKGLDYLADYPYGCAEQVMSSFLGNTALKGLQGFEALKILDPGLLEKNVSTGIQKLYSFQRFDGGFGYFEQGSGNSSPYLSAYILYGLHTAAKFGSSIDQSVMERTKTYLDGVLRHQNLEFPLELSTRAYILFVLSETGKTDLGLLTNLFDKKDELPVFAKSMLSMALQKAGAEEKSKLMLDKILETVKLDARGAHFEELKEDSWRALMHTNTRSTAIVLMNMIRRDVNHPIIPKVIRYLLMTREDGHWDTTQSSIMTVLAFIEYLQATGELEAEFEYQVLLNGNDVLSKNIDKKTILTRETLKKSFEELARGQETELTLKKTPSGKLYYDLLLEYFAIGDSLPEEEEGIGITREMMTFEGEEEVEDVQVGNTYKMKLTITIPQDRHFVAVESPLPAGFELIDLKLKTSQQILLEQDSGEVLEPYTPWSYSAFTHTELRDDRVFLFAEYLGTGVYEYEYYVRATLPGKFKYRPAKAFEMYFPETFGQTEGGWMEINF